MLKKTASICAVFAAIFALAAFPAAPAAAYGRVCFYMAPGVGYLGDVKIIRPAELRGPRLRLGQKWCADVSRVGVRQEIVGHVKAFWGTSTECTPKYLQDTSDGPIVYFVTGAVRSPRCRALD